MKTFCVLLPAQHSGHSHTHARLIGDHWRPWAVVFPLFWLVYHRLWVPLGFWLALNVGLSLWAPSLWLALPLLGLGRLWIALEGAHWIIAKFQRQGWHLAGVIEAENFDDAEWQFAHWPNQDYAAPKAKFEPAKKPQAQAETFGLLDMSRS